MLDYQLRELKRWNLLPVTNDSSLQGITFDGTYLWISSAGSTDKIFQIDASADSLLSSIHSMPRQAGREQFEILPGLAEVCGQLTADLRLIALRQDCIK